MAKYVYPIDINNKNVIKTQDFNPPSHMGIDWGAPKNTPIYASNSGTVAVKMFNAPYGSGFGGYGNVLLLSHSDGYYTLYAHCATLYVNQGATVVQGQLIAGVGNTGQVTGATGLHLHFEIRQSRDGNQINPLDVLEGRPVPIPAQWYTGNRYLSQNEQDSNALKVWQYFSAQGWSIDAICAMIGNMAVESTINPSVWYNLQPYSGAYGLTQWNPYTNYSEWAGAGWQNNGDKECARIQYELSNNLQWIKTDDYNITFSEFAHANHDESEEDEPAYSLDFLTGAFLFNYERAGTDTLQERITQARYYYNLLSPYPIQTKPPSRFKNSKSEKWIYYLNPLLKYGR